MQELAALYAGQQAPVLEELGRKHQTQGQQGGAQQHEEVVLLVVPHGRHMRDERRVCSHSAVGATKGCQTGEDAVVGGAVCEL